MPQKPFLYLMNLQHLQQGLSPYFILLFLYIPER